MAKGHPVVKILLYALNIGAAAALGASYLAGYISPEKAWILAFFGISYPVILAINLLFIVFWLITWKRFIFVSLATVIAGYSQLLAIFPLHLRPAATGNNRELAIVSFNVHSFGGPGKPGDRTKIKKQTASFVAGEKADIVCIQEFYSYGEDQPGILARFAGAAGLMHYDYRPYFDYKNKQKMSGFATFSRFPVISTGHLRLADGGRFALFSDLLIDSDTVRVYNVHLESIRFAQEDYSFYTTLTGPDEDEQTPIRQGSLRLLAKMKKAFITRAGQVDILKHHLSTCQHPVIIAGDFNDTPSSYTYRQLVPELSDSYVSSGSGLFGSTYAGKFPSFRIDYILYGKNFRSTGYRRSVSGLSDHYSIRAVLSRKAN